ncbi:uncharacterized protein LOC122373006 [Amphibalanus amphitrite]|uniref:uncharacterized protein LOC122373006 n=1 Tax=Amphibalanus amphitrite TaxID=1232801 RepID=UPI001C8FCC87|nr:uncharacterized protein LOC122373006 [Amphibalanus amphitrite]
MHFWVCKRSTPHTWGAHGPHVSSASWSPRPPPKRSDSPMPAPVHRYPPVPTAQRETSRRLAEHRQPPTNGESSRHNSAARASSVVEMASSDPAASEGDGEILVTEELDCDPARKCQSCCCIVVVTILVIFTLSLAKMYRVSQN